MPVYGSSSYVQLMSNRIPSVSSSTSTDTTVATAVVPGAGTSGKPDNSGLISSQQQQHSHNSVPPGQQYQEEGGGGVSDDLDDEATLRLVMGLGDDYNDSVLPTSSTTGNGSESTGGEGGGGGQGVRDGDKGQQQALLQQQQQHGGVVDGVVYDSSSLDDTLRAAASILSAHTSPSASSTTNIDTSRHTSTHTHTHHQLQPSDDIASTSSNSSAITQQQQSSYTSLSSMPMSTRDQQLEPLQQHHQQINSRSSRRRKQPLHTQQGSSPSLSSSSSSSGHQQVIPSDRILRQLSAVSFESILSEIQTFLEETAAARSMDGSSNMEGGDGGRADHSHMIHQHQHGNHRSSQLGYDVNQFRQQQRKVGGDEGAGGSSTSGLPTSRDHTSPMPVPTSTTSSNNNTADSVVTDSMHPTLLMLEPSHPGRMSGSNCRSLLPTGLQEMARLSSCSSTTGDDGPSCTVAALPNDPLTSTNSMAPSDLDINAPPYVNMSAFPLSSILPDIVNSVVSDTTIAPSTSSSVEGSSSIGGMSGGNRGMGTIMSSTTDPTHRTHGHGSPSAHNSSHTIPDGLVNSMGGMSSVSGVSDEDLAASLQSVNTEISNGNLLAQLTATRDGNSLQLIREQLQHQQHLRHHQQQTTQYEQQHHHNQQLLPENKRRRVDSASDSSNGNGGRAAHKVNGTDNRTMDGGSNDIRGLFSSGGVSGMTPITVHPTEQQGGHNMHSTGVLSSSVPHTHSSDGVRVGESAQNSHTHRREEDNDDDQNNIFQVIRRTSTASTEGGKHAVTISTSVNAHDEDPTQQQYTYSLHHGRSNITQPSDAVTNSVDEMLRDIDCSSSDDNESSQPTDHFGIAMI